MHGPMRRMAEAEEDHAKNRGEVVLRLVLLLKPYRGTLAISMLLVVVNAVTQGAGPLLIGRAVDALVTTPDASALARTMILLAVVYLLGMITMRYQIYLMSKVGQNLLADLRGRVFEKLESLSLQFLESRAAGDLMSRIVNDIDALNNFFSQALVQMIGAVFAVSGISIAMLIINWRLGLAVLVMLPVLWFTTRFFSGLARQAFRKTRSTLGDVSADLQEELGGVRVAQAFNRTNENVRRFAERNAANRDANVNATAVTSAFNPTMDILSTLDLALVAGMGGMLAIRGLISVGTVVAFIQYVQNFFRPIQTVAQMWTTAQSALAAAERVFDVLDIDATVVDAPDAPEMPAINGQVEFRDVTFTYDGEENVLDRVSFTAQPGQTVAVVGPTGAGKTTLVSLIARLYDVSGGEVCVDGTDVRTVQQRTIRRQMGIVTQEPFLFSGSLMDNIRYGRLDATDDEVRAAAMAANAHDFIERLPEGYATQVGERGSLLSQGQRQLVSIARAILADPRILVMDEATASVDTRTEVLIQKALQNLLKGRTSFVIAHRLSTVRNADQVLVIADGEIKERGTHNQLMQQNGLYAELYNRQFYQPDTEEAPV